MLALARGRGVGVGVVVPLIEAINYSKLVCRKESFVEKEGVDKKNVICRRQRGETDW